MSKIEWTDRSDWNPIRGCTKVSEGCRNCYAERIAARFSDPGQPFHGVAERTAAGPRWTGKIELIEERLDLPLRWRKPARIFVNSTYDLFHESVPDEWIDRVFAVMALAPQHTFLVLTKRPKRMRDYIDTLPIRAASTPARAKRSVPYMDGSICEYLRAARPRSPPIDRAWPLRNVWLGVSVENQATADVRIPLLLKTPSAVRFVSAEPLLGPMRLDRPQPRPSRFDHNGNGIEWIEEATWLWSPGGLDWIIVGGESGPRARPCEVAWIRSIVEQCRAAGTACFVKQLGKNIRDRNDTGFDADQELWADGPDIGQPTDPRAWPEPAGGVEHDTNGYAEHYQGAPVRVHLRSRAGSDPAEWPADLRVRQWPGEGAK